jgi:hypothetical protein
MIVFSSFNDVELFHIMFVDCCMLKSWEWGPMAAIGRRRPPSSINIDRACCRNHLLPLFFLLFCRHRHHASFPHDVPSRTTSITTDLAKRLPSRWLQFRRGCSSTPCQVSGGMLPYIFLRRTQLTTTPQRPSTGCDQNGRQRPPWCPTPDANAHNGHPVCWLTVVCGGAGSGAPWQPWDDGDCQGWRGMLFASFS